MHLTTYIAYASRQNDMNLGNEYNELVKASPTEVVCFLDHDATWLRKDWYDQIVHHMDQHPECGLLTVTTNRIGQKRQIWRKEYSNEHDIFKLRKAARMLTAYDWEPIPPDAKMSGVVIVTTKTAWDRAQGFRPGFLGVDNQYHIAMTNAGYEVHLLKSNPVYHFYRADHDLRHVQKANQLWHNYHP